jgi:S-disulfanyl-L-cysteine oxidoreductase SoxD
MLRLCSAVAFLLSMAPPLPAQAPAAKHSVGRTPTDQEIRALGVMVAPDGTGLPAGGGTAVEGRELFARRCAKCHGEKGDGDVGPPLVGGQGTLATAKPRKTVGSFWPYATSVWDYVNRAMPFNEPGLLNHDEVYSAVAYLLYLNGIVDEKQAMNSKTLPKVRMPNRDGFVADPRPDVVKKKRP